jgi:2-polyprenyl-3-methyl-5-hydroxy-6-metoxy-1,4-benzoquinol methylase
MRKMLYRAYWKLERIIHPALRYSQQHYYETLMKRLPSTCERWLDVGCGHQMLASWMAAQEQDLAARTRFLVGLDRELPALKKNPVIAFGVCGDVSGLPFVQESFDVITANMVVEHIENPASALQEVWRVLRPGGLFIFHTTNRHSVMMTLARMMPQFLKTWLAYVLEGRDAEDVFRTYYRMNTPRSISQQAARGGFNVQEIRAVSTSAVTALTPFSVIELLYLRILEHEAFENLRSNLIVTLKKDEPAAGVVRIH